MKHRSKTGNIRFQVQNISHSDITANPILKPRITARLFPIFLSVRSTSLRANTINLTESEKHEGEKRVAGRIDTNNTKRKDRGYKVTIRYRKHRLFLFLSLSAYPISNVYERRFVFPKGGKKVEKQQNEK